MKDYIGKGESIMIVSCAMADSPSITREDWNAIVDALLGIQPADVHEVKRGTWIEIYDDLIAGTCSACGWNSYMYEDDVIGMNYCPNCGAYMKCENDG